MGQLTARLRGTAVPAWLTDIVPPWLVTVVRPKPVPVPWANMLRAAIAISVPLAAGMAAGDRVLGLLTAMGGLLGVVVDNGGTYRHRLQRVGSAAVFGGAAGLTIGSFIHGRGWIAVFALIVVAGVSAVLGTVNDVGSVTGLQLLVYSSLGLGPLGALRPWWHTALGFMLGTVWALVLTLPGLLLSPRAAERQSVAAVYHALAGELRAVGGPGFADARSAATAAMNAAYDTVLTVRSTAGGRSEVLRRLVGMLNQANLIAEATTAIQLERGRPPPQAAETLDRVADAVAERAASPAMPQVPATSRGSIALRDSLAGLDCVLARDCVPHQPEQTPKPPLRDRIGAWRDTISSRLTRTFAVRLMLCVGVAGVVSEVLPLQRSYWVVLTVAIVLKPAMGSVFARAVQRGLGTVVGAVLGAVIIVVVPYGPWLLLPFAALAALLPYGQLRNYGLQATFLTPLVVVLIDLLAPGGWQLAEARLLDTLIGCAIVLLIGYAPWPMSWQAHLPAQFAETIRSVSGYLREALTSPRPRKPATAAGAGRTAPPAGADATRLPGRSRQQREALRSLSDLRAEFERTMSEPAAVSRRATAWWPALVGLDEVMDAVTATAVAISHGAPAPSPDAVRRLASVLDALADAVQAGAPPSRLPELPSDEPLGVVTEAVRAVLGVIASPSEPAPRPEGGSGADATARRVG
jgi:uncharacterized membrane protein YccC